MNRILSWRAVFCLGLLLAGEVTGCHHADKPPIAENYFKTHFQDESQYIVESIATDVAEQVYFAKFHHLPPAKEFSVAASETAASVFRTPVYELTLDLDKQHQGLKTVLKIGGPIWSPEIYDDLTRLLASRLDLPAIGNNDSKDTALMAQLTDGSAVTIEQRNQALSAALENDFANPTLHEQAALLLGAFTLREHSGNFFDTRQSLCRVTAHLALARYLGGTDYDLNGTVATAMLLTAMNNQAAALDLMNGLTTTNSAAREWIRALQARNTGDYRPLQKLSETDTLTPVESFELYRALVNGVNPDLAWGKLADSQKKIPDFLRIAHEVNESVGVENELYPLTFPVETSELTAVCQLAAPSDANRTNLTDILNIPPERCFSAGDDRQMHVRIIGWGQWAAFLQRHLCQAVWRDYYYLSGVIGSPDEARTFSTQCDEAYRGLRLDPFRRRFMAADMDACHLAMDDGIKVTVEMPQWVPSYCWNYATAGYGRNDGYQAVPNPHLNEWHKHNPPPGTAYNLPARLGQPSMTGRSDTMQLLDEVHTIAPYDWALLDYIINRKYNRAPDHAQVADLLGALPLYSVKAMKIEAASVRDQTQQYERLMLRAADLDPSANLVLAIYYQTNHLDEKAVDYYEKSIQLDPNSVAVANQLNWLMHYYLRKNREEDARRVADFAGEVYSYSGLFTKADFFESTGHYKDAFEWYSKIKERYNDSRPVINFGYRHKDQTGDGTYLASQADQYFPKGMEPVSLESFKAPPADGVVLNGNSELLQQAGMKGGDVVVAISGIRVHNKDQYSFERDLLTTPELDLIVWQGKGYHEIKASPPKHLFGVEIGNYQAN